MSLIIIRNKSDLKKKLTSLSFKKVNFIPTMGNLHDGHLSLIKKAKKNGFLNLVSIYINPLQFDDKNDLRNYPRTINQDILKLKNSGVDMVFMPEKKFNNNDSFTLNVDQYSKKLCGLKRIGHFEGVATIILKFLFLIQPDNIFLGEKDYQQILVIKKVIRDFNFNTKVVAVQTLRDKNGVAFSSRNQFVKDYSSLQQIYKNLRFMRENILMKKFSLSQLKSVKHNLINSGIDKVNYLELLKESDLSNLDSVPTKSRLFISVKIEDVNLIDNISVNKKLWIGKNSLIKFS